MGEFILIAIIKFIISASISFCIGFLLGRYEDKIKDIFSSIKYKLKKKQVIDEDTINIYLSDNIDYIQGLADILKTKDPVEVYETMIKEVSEEELSIIKAAGRTRVLNYIRNLIDSDEELVNEIEQPKIKKQNKSNKVKNNQNDLSSVLMNFYSDGENV